MGKAIRRLCIDIDNVVAQSDDVMREVIAEFTKGRVRYRRSDIVEFKYQRCKDRNNNSISQTEWNQVHAIFSEPVNLWRIQPVDRVQDYLRTLAEKYSIHFATSRLPEARRTTVEWLEAHNFPPHDLHFISHGEKHAALGAFAAAVEDDYSQAADFADSGTPAFLIRHPWNRSKPKRDRLAWVTNWKQLTDQLMRLP